MDLSAFQRNVLIVIVIYKKDFREVLKNIFPFRKASATIYVYDNSPDAQQFDEANVIYVHDPNNPGVSKAYNSALKQAATLKKSWLLLLDQDTHLPNDADTIYYQAVRQHPNAGIYVPVMLDTCGIISPFRFFWGRPARSESLKAGVHLLNQFYFINSGMLIASGVFQSAGGYDEHFPLDFSDMTFVDRLKTVRESFVLMDMRCNHHLSFTEVATDSQEVLRRFRIYCHAVRLYKKLNKTSMIAETLTMPLAFRLFFRYRKVEFFRIALTRP